ncbi:MAG TPA: Hsp20/alpha crystallin family protein [Candidatus Limnocylindria bacterium]|nr:Hsp20/alpha crystallin family protein [Candidatus Limnocylindria bacterium]
MGELFGFDPFRLMGQPETLGFDIQRTDNGYRLEVPVAGFKPEEINVTVEERQLTIEGHSDRRRFTRAVVLPDEIDADRIEANVEHGLLTLTLPLHPRVQPRRIEVKLGKQLPAGSAGTIESTPSTTTATTGTTPPETQTGPGQPVTAQS